MSAANRGVATRCGALAGELRLLKLALERGDARPKVVADVAALLRLLAADLERTK